MQRLTRNFDKKASRCDLQICEFASTSRRSINLTGDGTNTWVYDVENRLVSARGLHSAALRYDPLGRLHETVTGVDDGIPANDVTVRRLYDGGALVAEYDQTGTLLRRFVHGPNTGADTPLVWYEGPTMSQAAARMLNSDLQGSVTSVTDFGGNPIALGRYDEYGRPQSGNVGRFQYTGQAWLPEIGLYYYKARMYSPTLGRFMQTDPIGYADGVNWYNYVGGDPVNAVDPTGMDTACNDGSVQRTEDGGGECDDRGGVEGIGVSSHPGWASFGGIGGAGGGGGRNCAEGLVLISDGGGFGRCEPRFERIEEQTPLCQDLHREAERARSILPGRVAVDKVWDDAAALRFFKGTYAYNRNDFVVISIGAAAAGGVNSKKNKHPVAKEAIDLVSKVTVGVSGLASANYQRHISAIDKRLLQIDRINDGSCPIPLDLKP